MKKRILVVDDDSMNLMRTKMILGQEYQVVLAESGAEALNRLKEDEEQIDMVLLDIDMPEMNGIETFERMKDFAADIPVIFLTASGAEDDVVSAIRLGAVNYLKKPFRPQELMRRVAQEGRGTDKQTSAAGCHYHGIRRNAEPGYAGHGMGVLDGGADGSGLHQRVVSAYRKDRLGCALRESVHRPDTDRVLFLRRPRDQPL